MTDVAAPARANGRMPPSLFAFAADRIQPRRRTVTARRVLARVVVAVWVAVGPHLLTVAAVGCAAAAAFTYAVWSGLAACAAGLWLVELHVSLDHRPARPPGGRG